MKSPAKRNVVFPAAEAEPEGFRKKDVLPKSSASFFFSLQSAVFSLQPVLPRAERMSGRAFWGSGRLPLTRAAGGIRICTDMYGGVRRNNYKIRGCLLSVPIRTAGVLRRRIRTHPYRRGASVRKARSKKARLQRAASTPAKKVFSLQPGKPRCKAPVLLEASVAANQNII